MAVSSKLSIKKQVRSISLPCRSHPTTIQIEEHIYKIKTAAAETNSTPSADTICSGLSQLAEVYKCMDELLNSPATKLLISRQENKNWVEELVDESVKFLDVCGGIRDMVAQIKEHVLDLHCALRRRKNLENSIVKYNCFRKKMRKDVKLLVANLKQVDHNMIIVDSDNNHHLISVIKAVIGVSEMTVSVFKSLLLFFSMPISKPNKWSLVVSKFMHKGTVACDQDQEQEIVNEFEGINAALQTLCKYEPSTQVEKMGIAKFRLEKLEKQIECLETKLESMFRQLIGARASLLNISLQ